MRGRKMTHKQCFCTKCQTSWIGTVDYCPNCGNKEVYVGTVSTTEFPELATKLATSCKNLATSCKNLATKQGRWIIYTVSPWDGEDVKCSVCGEKGCAPYWDYCPHCGSQMVDVVSENEL